MLCQHLRKGIADDNRRQPDKWERAKQISPLSMIITGCGIHRDVRNNLGVNLYIDLINAVTQIFIMIRRDAIVFQQAFLKLLFPRLIIGRGVCILGRVLISRCISLIRRFNLCAVRRG